ncbi:MAG: hypothetical protein QF464_07120 [Myxococcota bacterium]|nr:hypothetical protein [Myxococcota bacterium]
MALSVFTGCGLSADSTAGQAGGAEANGRVAPNRPGGGLTLADIVTGPTPDISAGDVGDPGPEDAPGDSAGPHEDADSGLMIKADDTYLVPIGVGSRGQVAASTGTVAWVEREAPGEVPHLVVWRVGSIEPPRHLRIPNLSRPAQLALSSGWLVYVDNRYGDEDIFAVNLDTGLEQAVVTAVGPQVEPAVRGDVVVWRDCRHCVSGDVSASDIYRVVLDSGEPEQRLTDSTEEERRPALGTLADGSEAVVWIEGHERLRVVSDGVSEAWDVGAFVSTVGVTAGRLMWREQTGVINPDSMKPLVINPDSMMPVGVINPDSMIPTDVYGTNALTGDTEAVSVHAEIAPQMEGAVQASGGRVAWVEADPDLGLESRVVVADAESADVETVVEVDGVWAPALSADLLVFVAPRDDNDDMNDVWVLPLAPNAP